MAELTAIGWVVSPMIRKMMEKIPSYIMGQYRWDRNMKKDFQKLERTLLQIQGVVDKAKGWHTMDDSQKRLLRHLKDAAYETDDLLDEFEYRDMETRAKMTESTVSRATSSSVKFGKRLIGQDKLRNNLTEILKKWEDVKEVADSLVKLAQTERNSTVEQVGISSGRATGSKLTETKIVGRDEKKDEIVNLLLESTNHKSESSSTSIPIISIIGHGGIGKTTLAQIICNDQRIQDQFPLRIWICVSDNFDEIKLTREILQCVSKSDEIPERIINFDKLQQELGSKLNSKRFLLVLDDVWLDEKKGDYHNGEMWRKLFVPLQDGLRDSKILVTTRIEKVAKIFGVTNSISLEGLKNDEMWSLLKMHAFDNENLDNYRELNEIGIQIAERLKGSPLACKVVGSMLRDRLDATKWKEILEREMPDDVISVLRLSYQHLPDHLKQCFAYCSIFPKDWYFEAEQLVLLWIAQGYIEIPSRNNRSLVDVGMDYFHELLYRSFFQKAEQNSDRYYVIHDLMHDMAEDVSMDECFRIDHGKQRKIMQPVRHLGVVLNDKYEMRDFVAQWEKIGNFQNLRTLIFFIPLWKAHIDLPQIIFKELKCVRVLDCGRGSWERTIVPESIGNLIHLRYLRLSLHLTGCLPRSLYKLYHLQVLATSSFCESMMKLIKFGKLIRLDMDRLNFRVEKKGGQSMGVLKDMAAVLRGELEISYLENVTDKEEAMKADLESMQHLDGLMLTWSSESRIEWSQERDEEVAEALKPHLNLKWLRINGFRGIRFPNWLAMINLQSIQLCNCGCLEVLPPLGHLRWLKELIISNMDAVKRVGSEFYGVVDDSDGFPSLEVLEFDNMPEWLEWCGADFPVFPHLHELHVRDCPKLIRFPLLPASLSVIYIIDTALVSEMRMKPPEPQSSSKHFGLKLVKSIVPPSALLHDNILAAIEQLLIKDYTGPMPAGCFLKLAALRRLTFERCQESLAIDALPASLESLIFYYCQVTDRWVSRCLHGLTHLSELTIWNCDGLMSLPSAQVLQHLIALQTLQIGGWKELTSLGALHCLTSLKVLKLFYCPEMKSWPEEGLPASIEELFLHNCHPALMQQIREKKGPEWDKVAHIPPKEIDYSS